MAKNDRGTPPRNKTRFARRKKSKKPKAGRTLEMLTARIEGSISDLDVTVKSPDQLPDLVAGGTREVDVSLRSKVGSADVLVIIECRDRGRPADVSQLEQVRSKRDAVGASKAIAVASGSFSKRALIYADKYGIDARTLAQANTAEIRRWAGALQMFVQTAIFDNAKVTVKLGGAGPFPPEIGARFDELIKAQQDSFDAKFILYSGTEGLLSPLDVIRKKQNITQITKGSKLKITLPANSEMIVSENPTMMTLVGTPPVEGSSADRHHVLEFAEGEALFGTGEFTGPLVAVHLDFTVRITDKTPVAPQTYSYASSTGVIQVAEHVGNIGGEPFILTQHRQGEE